MTSGSNTLRADLVAVIEKEFGADDLALSLFQDFLGAGGYVHAIVTQLIDVAGARRIKPTWPLRRAAVLILESRLLALPADDLAGFEPVLRAIAADPSSGLTYPPGPSVLAEGYTTTEPQRFIGELRDRLARHAPVHRKIEGPGTSPEALRGFLALAREESKLTLARYLFTPHDVARRILEQVRTSRGLPAPFQFDLVGEEAEELLNDWPPYERALVAKLLAGSKVLWVGDETSSRLNALVEYPLGTVVLVVKPPGSDREIQFKRAGRRGDQPLSVVHDRENLCVPATHRLDGGSMGTSLRAESSNAAAFGKIYRLIHGRPAPISVTLAHTAVHEIPCARGRADLLDYFTRPDVFGPGFGAMREAIRRSIRSFCREWKADALDAPGELGVTVAFLGQVNPVQAVLGGTSSFRLDLLAHYLSAGGPNTYFQQLQAGDPSPDEATRFTETLLDEILGGYRPVEAHERDHVALIKAVLNDPVNRRKADDTFIDLAEQAGTIWGTIFGIKAYSLGESFVGRNVGLRSVWERGAWRARLVYMDHDMLSVPRDRYDPGHALWGCYADVRYILFDPPGHRRCELDLLASIYRVDDATAGRGRSAFLLSARAAYQRTKSRLAADPLVRGMFQEGYLNDLLDWEEATAAFIAARQLGRDEGSSLRAGADLLRGRGHPEPVVDSFTDLVGRYAEFLLYFAVLYGAGPTEPRGPS